MNNFRKFNEFDITVVNFERIFESVQLLTLNSIRLTTTKNNYISFDLDCKRYFLHYLIKETCDYMRTIIDKNKILFIGPTFYLNNYEIWSFMDRKEISQFVYNSFKNLKENLPFPIFCSEDSINLTELTGETIDALNIMSMLVSTHSTKPVTTKKLKEFSKKNGLTYLTNTYYVSSEFKKLLYGSQ